MSSEIRIGLVGCGRVAESVYLSALKRLNHSRIVAVAEPSAVRRDWASSQMEDCTIYEYLNNEMLDAIDAAIVLTPPENHLSIAKTLLHHHKYALIEKPLAISLYETLEFGRTFHAKMDLLKIGFNHRFWKPVIQLKNELSKFQPTGVSFNFEYTGIPASWHAIGHQSHVLDNLGSHIFDLLRFSIQREYRSVQATQIGTDAYQLNLQMAGDVMAQGIVAYATRTKKNVLVNSAGKNLLSLKIYSERILPPSGVARHFLDFKDIAARKLRGNDSSLNFTYTRQLQAFEKFVLEGANGIAGYPDGLASLKVSHAAKASVRQNGKKIYFDEIEE